LSQFRRLAPAGAPISPADLARWAALALSDEDVQTRLCEEVRGRFGVRHCLATSTGRAGLTVLLRALRRLAPDRDEVIIPSYTCYSVAASVIRAHCRLRVVDVDPATLDYSYDQLAGTDFRRVVAIIATNLYGLPNDLPALRCLAEAAKVFLVDDAAQAMEAEVGGRLSGTWGHAGLFSLDKGKNVSAIDGGLVTTNSDAIYDALQHEAGGLDEPRALKASVDILKVLVYFALLPPRLYWIPSGIPQLELGATRFDTTFALESASRPLAALAVVTLKRLSALTRGRCEAAETWREGLKGVRSVQLMRPLAGSRPVYLRFPILFSDPDARRRALERIDATGGGVSASYPQSVVDVPDVRQFMVDPSASATGGRYVAARIMTLPTHAFVDPSDTQRILDAVVAASRDDAETDGETRPDQGTAVCAG
jgi:perosamine synthetase